jgi:anti-anti-sigma regulatory factor
MEGAPVIEAQPLDAHTLLVIVRGAADRLDALHLHRSILKSARGGATRAVVDLTEVSDVQPGVLGVLLSARRHLLDLGGALVVVTSLPASSLFGVAGADELLSRASTVHEALSRFGAKPEAV